MTDSHEEPRQEAQQPPAPDAATYPANEPGPEVEPGIGGYAGRDPKTEMPRVPTAPETQEDSDTEYE
jgi:hypothetical protein